jgi:hypothetical protein
MVELQGNAADRTNASGTAVLAGTVGAVNLGGSLARSYTILSAAGGRTAEPMRCPLQDSRQRW